MRIGAVLETTLKREYQEHGCIRMEGWGNFLGLQRCQSSHTGPKCQWKCWSHVGPKSFKCWPVGPKCHPSNCSSLGFLAGCRGSSDSLMASGQATDKFWLWLWKVLECLEVWKVTKCGKPWESSRLHDVLQKYRSNYTPWHSRIDPVSWGCR